LPFFHTSKGFLTFCKILRHGTDGFTSHLKEGVPQIFIAAQLAMTEPVNLGSNGKHTSHYTAEDGYATPTIITTAEWVPIKGPKN
jgi:hypothetical protein